MFDKRNSSTRLEVIHDSIQIINCLDLYFKLINTRISLIYLETWQYGNQIDIVTSVKQTLYNFLEYSKRKLYKVSYDAIHLLTGGFSQQFEFNEIGMSIPDSICSSKAVSVSQEANINEPFITASSMAHMLGHNLGMEHDEQAPQRSGQDSDKLALVNASAQPVIAGVGSHNQKAKQPRPAQTGSGGKSPHGHHPSSSNNKELDGEDHEDEIKSRSLPTAPPSLTQPTNPTITDNDLNEDSSADQEYCRSNCLMSERLSYMQPPVIFGNMVQQQVAAEESGGSAHIVNVSSQPDSLNGFTMEQIDSSGSGGGVSSEQHPRLPQHHSLPFKFSKQSVDIYHRLLRLGHGICLFNKPNQLEDFKLCGNGIVDKGEDCDCGTIQECFEQDSCCDPITCHFKADAECINGSCCDRCSLRKKGFVCRKARNECDLAELCDGKSGQCGPDVYKQNGTPCSNSQGYCFLGQCPSHDAQCNELWALDSRSSSEQCYMQFNLNGTIRGNCGPLSGGAGQESHHQQQHQLARARSQAPAYKKCEHEDMMCGTLQCQLGDMKPVTATLSPDATTAAKSSGPSRPANGSSTGSSSSAEYSKKVLHSFDGQQHHECKVIIAQPGSSPAVQALSYVRDGSKCGHNKVCFNQTCQPIESVYRDSFELCPRDERGNFCSANGICSTANKCHCDLGWLGHDCSQREQVQEQATAGADQHHQQITSTIITLVNEPVNVPLVSKTYAATGAPTTASAAPPITSPSPPPPLADPTTPSDLPSSTTQASSTAGLPTTSGPTSSTVVVDKKKHDAFGAPTLVFILVSIVAAVYVGFALMANCYRRKGFLKPDKVLRHHQMNCRLDAMRSSFIARRLADAEVVLQDNIDPGVTEHHQNGPTIQQATSALDLSQMQCQHDLQPAPVAGSIYNTTNKFPGENFPTINRAFNQAASQQQAQQQQFTTATVHYYKENQPLQGADSGINFIGLSEPNEFGDHVPLLDHQQQQPLHQHRHHHHHHKHYQHQLQHRHPIILKSFSKFPMQTLGKQPIIYQDQTNLLQMQNQTINSKQVIQPMSIINRATSLGNVNRQYQQQQQPQQQQQMMGSIDDDQRAQQGDYEVKRMHRALATPLRVARVPVNEDYYDKQQRIRSKQQLDLDSCSALSSPDHRDPCWSDEQNRLVMLANNIDQSSSAYNTIGRQQSFNNLTIIKPQTQAHVGYHEEVIFNSNQPGRKRLSSLSSKRQHSLEQQQQDDNHQRLPTPPPPPASDGKHEASEEDESSEQMTIASSRPTNRSSRSPLRTSATTWSMKTIRRVPLNDQDDYQQENDTGMKDTSAEELTLIAQLQQLERVQSLHQKQLNQRKGNNSNSGDGQVGLHEFFSLPLSIQLSALLARTLHETTSNVDNVGSTLLNTPLDDYLNNLNNSSVASSSRRSFKRINPTGASGASSSNSQSRSGTLKRQQVKLQNLQGLIKNLQQLHNQTIIQQQIEQLKMDNDDYDEDDDNEEIDNNNRDLSLSRSKLNGKATYNRQHRKQAVDDNWQSNRVRGNKKNKSNNNSRPESIYSMSDSEDGGGPNYVSRVITAYQQHHSINDNNNSNKNESKRGADIQVDQQQQPLPPPPMEAEDRFTQVQVDNQAKLTNSSSLSTESNLQSVNDTEREKLNENQPN